MSSYLLEVRHLRLFTLGYYVYFTMKMHSNVLLSTIHLYKGLSAVIMWDKFVRQKIVLAYQCVWIHIPEAFLALVKPRYALFQEYGYIRWIDFIACQLFELSNGDMKKYLFVFIPFWTMGSNLCCTTSMMSSWQLNQAHWLLLS